MSDGAQRLARLVAGLFLLVTIAASVGSDVGSGNASSSPWLARALIVLAAAAVLGGMLTAVSAGAYAAFIGTGSHGKTLILGTGVVLFAAVVTTILLLRPEYRWVPSGDDKPCVNGVYFWLHFPSRRDELFQDDSGRFCWLSGGGALAGEAGGGGGGTDIPRALVAAAGGIVALTIVLATATAIVARRSRRRVSASVEREDPVAQALHESLDDLRREKDVRRAIVACYARMERALAGSGRGRRAHETPPEFLRRVLERVAPEPGQTLTELFELATFSVEPMGEIEKRRAVAALEQVRTEVTG